MDGLREDAAILFVLTTNRPDQLEPRSLPVLAEWIKPSKFPLPDDEGRAKLVRLYSRGLQVPAEVCGCRRPQNKKASAAFIKELMRRCAQFVLKSQGTEP